MPPATVYYFCISTFFIFYPKVSTDINLLRPAVRSCFDDLRIGCPRNNKKNFSLNRNKPEQDLFCFSVSNYIETTETKQILFWFVSVQTEIFLLFRGHRNNWNKQNCFETNPNNPKFSENYQNTVCSLWNCFGWSSVCFAKLSVSI